MRFADPVFVVPSAAFHRLADPKRHGEFWRFTMKASMDPRSRDKWQPHRVPAVKAGARLLEIMADLKKQQHGRGLALAPVPQGPDVLLVHVVD